jgi:hypothetical protein
MRAKNKIFIMKLHPREIPQVQKCILFINCLLVGNSGNILALLDEKKYSYNFLHTSFLSTIDKIMWYYTLYVYVIPGQMSPLNTKSPIKIGSAFKTAEVH